MNFWFVTHPSKNGGCHPSQAALFVGINSAALEAAMKHSQELEELQRAARNALESALMEQHLSDVVREVREMTKEVRAGGTARERLDLALTIACTAPDFLTIAGN